MPGGRWARRRKLDGAARWLGDGAPRVDLVPAGNGYAACLSRNCGAARPLPALDGAEHGSGVADALRNRQIASPAASDAAMAASISMLWEVSIRLSSGYPERPARNPPDPGA